MATVYDVEPNVLIEKASEELKKNDEIKPPEWAAFVKTGISRQRPPVEKDWWYTRAAAVLRKVYRLGPIGTSKLRTHYGGKKNRGAKKEHTYPASGNIIRKILQQLEKAELISKVEKGQFRGRKISPKGRSFLDKVATKINGVQTQKKSPAPVKAKKVVEKKPEQKTVEVKKDGKS
tara:strand:- start:10 stop:537 length:528 start_codon:yes stop_codon:yes gene_type:complete